MSVILCELRVHSKFMLSSFPVSFFPTRSKWATEPLCDVATQLVAVVILLFIVRGRKCCRNFAWELCQSEPQRPQSVSSSAFLISPHTVSVALVCQHFTTTRRATRKWDRLCLTTQLIPVDKLTLCDNIIMSPWQQSFLWYELSYPRDFFSLIGRPKQFSNLRWKFYDKGKVCCFENLISLVWCFSLLFFLSFIDLNENYHFAEQEWADKNKNETAVRAETKFLVWEWK